MKIELTLNEGMNVAKAFRDTAIAWGCAEEAIQPVVEEYAAAFDAAMKAIGIKLVVNTVAEENEDKSNDNIISEANNPYPPALTVKDDFILHYMKEGYSFDEALEVADILFGKEDE